MPAFDLARFLTAQAPVYEQALAELRAGRKESHWMWFIFPQLAGLGRSATARFYGIVSADEAKAYLADRLLGARLLECVDATMRHQGVAVASIFGPVDAMKFRSSMTLFDAMSAEGSPFAAALDAFYGGTRDAETLRLLKR